jgi:hypothetical protein
MPENDSVDSIKNKISKKIYTIKLLIYSAYGSSLLLLLAVCLAIISSTKSQPFYSWIEHTQLQRIGQFTAGLIIEQKVNMQINAENTPLSEDELQQLNKLFKKDHWTQKKTIDKSTLSARDSRFILSYPKMTPIQAGNYLILTNSEAPEIQLFGGILDDLYVSFIKEMHPYEFTNNTFSKPHVCYLKNRSNYLAVSRKSTQNFHDSLGFFSPIKNCIYLFSRQDSLEGLELEEKFDALKAKGEKLYKGRQLDVYLDSLDLEKIKYKQKLKNDTLCTLRHEGTHQLSHILGLHSQRGFEKKWLTEGIAQYFETKIPGESREAKKVLLQSHLEKKELIDWEQLINSYEGSFKSNGHKERQLAYSQSWLTVRFLMKKYKNNFFLFIKKIKNTSAMDTPQTNFELLCSCLGTSRNKFIAELNQEISQL